MKWKTLTIFTILLMVTSAIASEEELSVLAIKHDLKNHAEQVVVKMDDKKLEDSFLEASSEIGQLVEKTTQGVSDDLPSNFKLDGIDVEFSFNANGGFMLFSAGAEGGVVLHYTERK